MDGVGPGTVLGGRYVTDRRIEQRLDTERWTAQDSTLGRHVEVLCLSVADPRSAPLLDAARRAAALDAPSLVRILDVGRDEQVAYVVEEDLSDYSSLTELVEQGGLPADEVRRIVGEVATALDAAGQRGLHHLALSPADVLRTHDGEVKVRGVATGGVCAGIDGLETEAAARRDAVGVVAVAYAGLTGLWPQPGDSGGLAYAPLVPTGVAAPSELASGVPRDLDALCRLTLNDDQGPLSPGDFARQIAPWSPVPVDLGSAQRPTAPAPTDSTVVLPVQRPTPSAPEPPAGGATALVGAGAAVSDAMARAGDRVGGLARQVGQRAASLGSAGDVEAPAPLVPSDPLTRDESRIALAIVAAFLVLALIIGIWGVSHIGSGTNLGLGGGTSTTSPQISKTTTASPTGSASASGSASGTATGTLEPLAILSADAFDPLGDNTENNSQVARVFDDNPSTQWTSERYNTADFGGLKKGVGVIVDLGPNVRAREVDLILPVAADVTVYIANERSLSGATAIGSQAGAQGTVKFPVTGDVTGQYIIVWFTKLTQDGNGEYRAHLAEVIPLG